MRKLKLQIQMSLDGFVAGPNGEGDWVFISGRDEFAFQKIIDMAASSDTILLGRKMSEGFLKHWENVVDNQPGSPEQPLAKLMVDLRKVIFSRSQTATQGRNASMENRDLVAAVRALKEEPGKDILVYGGASFVRSLIHYNLIDEYNIIRCPVALGEGMRIFTERTILKLVDTISYNNGKVLNTYLPA